MRRILLTAALAGAALPAWGQTTQWSQPTRTGNWSETFTLPSPAAPAPAAPAASPGTARTGQWAAPVHTERRSDQDVQRQVDGIVRDAERRARAGAGAAPAGTAAAGDVRDRVWRDHVERTRAQEQFRREQDAHYERQRFHTQR